MKQKSRHKKTATTAPASAVAAATTAAAASFSDLDGLVIMLIASRLDVRSAASLAATNRQCRDVIAHEDNVAFWKRVAGEVWGCRGVDDPNAVPRLPGERGAGPVAGSWKQCCVEHSDRLSRYGEDGRRAARAWHRIEAALAVVAPRALAALEPGYQIPPYPDGGEMMSREVLAAAAIHNGQKVIDPERAAANFEEWAAASLFGSVTVYGQGFFMPMRNLVPSMKGTRLAREVACSRSASGEELVPCSISGLEEEYEGDEGAADNGKIAIARLHLFAAPYFAMEGVPVGDTDLSQLSFEGARREDLPIEGINALGVDVGNGRVFSVSLIENDKARLLPARPADDDGKGLLFYLDKLGEAIERGQLGSRPRSEACFPLSGSHQTIGVGPISAARLAAETEQRGRTRLAPPPRARPGTGTGGGGGSLSRFPSAPPGLASRLSHDAILVSISSTNSWLASMRTPNEARAIGGGFFPVRQIAEMFSYEVTMRLLSVEEQREAHAAAAAASSSSSAAAPFRPIRRATLATRHWEIRNAAGELVDTVDGRGVVGFTPTLVAREGRDDDRGDGDGDGGGDWFSYCSRCDAPDVRPTPPRNARSGGGRAATAAPPPRPAKPGEKLGEFGGHFVFDIERDGDGEEGTSASTVNAEVPTLGLVVPEVQF